jgi:hypothetical protein
MSYVVSSELIDHTGNLIGMAFLMAVIVLVADSVMS